MPRSMTGYGRGLASQQGRSVQLELKAVNSRYCELNLRLPRLLSALDLPLRRQLQAEILRGKVDIFVSVDESEGGLHSFRWNRALVKQFLQSSADLAEELQLKTDWSLRDLLQLEGLCEKVDQPQEANSWAKLLEQACEEALQQFVQSRRLEGERLLADILPRVQQLENHLSTVEAIAPEVPQQYLQKLEKRMQEALAERELDEGRVVMELVALSDKTDITEEIVRMRAHLQSLRQTLQKEQGQGKRLDFLLQEIQRETNTIGSKANWLAITEKVVEMKVEIEKIREQVQNLE